MTREEAKTKFKEIMETEIDRMANHYDVDVVYNNVDKIEELLELNKIVCEAIEKQIPKYPVCVEDKMWSCPVCDNGLLRKWSKYPTELMPKSLGLPHCMACGQALNWKDE